jgi:hypothetical protein
MVGWKWWGDFTSLLPIPDDFIDFLAPILRLTSSRKYYFKITPLYIITLRYALKMALFPPRDILLSFKAGKSFLQDKVVNSDRRKGMLIFKRDKTGVNYLFTAFRN